MAAMDEYVARASNAYRTIDQSVVSAWDFWDRFWDFGGGSKDAAGSLS
jgi:hypothetical protein